MIQVVKKITAWSFSRWQAYEECPRKAKYKFIDKLPEPQGEALVRGTALHELCEFYLKGIIKKIPPELKLITQQLKELKKAKAVPEAEFAFNRDWKPVDWFAKDAWCRVKADSTILPITGRGTPTVKVDDFKSGKLKPEGSTYDLQLELYALAGLMTYSTAEQADTSLIFIDHGKSVASNSFTRKDIQKLQAAWERRTKRMLADTKFVPNPGNACRYCHFKKGNGGPCEY